MNCPHLVVIPSVPVWQEEESLIFDRKFYDGMLQYVGMWPGEVSCILSATSTQLPSFGIVSRKWSEMPFHCIILDSQRSISEVHLQSASVVLASGDSFDQFHISKVCKNVGAKCIYVIEYTPESHYQIASLSAKNLLARFRKFFYIWKNEKKRLSAFSLADALQINGMAAYSEYRRSNADLLYFDTRVDHKHMVSREVLSARLDYLSSRKPLCLAFSGRLIAMKGADHLIAIAALLKAQNVQFSMTIYGTGELEQKMRNSIIQLGLEDMVSMPGAVDFYQELIPALQQNVDLFIMPHRQSDPSCTYLETLACGIPIVGYKNKAFSGLLERADIGWGVQIDDLQSIAGTIKYLSLNREEIAQKSLNSINFAYSHSFELTFKRRTEHLYALSQSERLENHKALVSA
ncbi:glycosyltransferase [Leptolyngbya sp. O-77]|uniref:glycosyltransferase n=1 Tax=Leptolyngbya sp. O-77 TaxID=1080068 RepID=UPI00074D2A80|nr:glycosyltransferase [Leptolyngbya sp. O-77]BAU44418.1 Glycosyltransferase Gtf1 [Leptolyngbya sp. O-77]